LRVLDELEQEDLLSELGVRTCSGLRLMLERRNSAAYL
jgi:hypothetical protein